MLLLFLNLSYHLCLFIKFIINSCNFDFLSFHSAIIRSLSLFCPLYFIRFPLLLTFLYIKVIAKKPYLSVIHDTCTSHMVNIYQEQPSIVKCRLFSSIRLHCACSKEFNIQRNHIPSFPFIRYWASSHFVVSMHVFASCAHVHVKGFFILDYSERLFRLFGTLYDPRF